MLETPALEALLEERPFTAADRMLVDHLRNVWSEANNWVLYAAALASRALREGHVFLDLSLPPELAGNRPAPAWPELPRWGAWLRESPAARNESSDAARPLVLCADHALYLEKYYAHERELAQRLLARASREARQSFDSTDPIQRALSSDFFVITGGPGTGKTTLALRYLNALLDEADADSRTYPPRFATVAPTGKAAARLAESIATGVERLDATDERKEQLRAIPCLTIHRLLGALPNRVTFRRDERRPIDFDAIVIDEASMIDLPLMLRLFRALPPSCRALLLGDRDQLSSVEVGSVLHDLIEAAERPGSPLRARVERLTKTYRFREDSAIYLACQLAQRGDADGFQELIDAPPPDLRFQSVSSAATRPPESLFRETLNRHRSVAESTSAEQALAALSRAIILCPTRAGPFGANAVNAEIERRIRAQDNATPHAPIHGMPVIVLENDYELELFNGDLGIVWQASANSPAEAFFPAPQGAPRRYRLAALPRHEAAFALTIHKSQGSEFDLVIGLFGPGDSKLLTRELLYTCFSRAKRELILYGHPPILAAAIERRVRRATRLAELLR